MKIVYCSDSNTIPLLKMSAETVLKFNPDAEIFVVSKEILNVPYKNIKINTSGYTFRRNESDRVTEATYYRLFLPTLGFDRCIYLDCDILCAGSLRELWNMDIPYIGICHSHNYGIIQARRLNIPMYGSAGMLFLNCENLRKICFTQTLMRILKFIQPPGQFYHDETLLNVVYADLFTFLPGKWLKCKNRLYSAYNDEVLFSKSILRHYIGGQKAAQKHDYIKIMEQR